MYHSVSDIPSAAGRPQSVAGCILGLAVAGHHQILAGCTSGHAVAGHQLTGAGCKPSHLVVAVCHLLAVAD